MHCHNSGGQINVHLYFRNLDLIECLSGRYWWPQKEFSSNREQAQFPAPKTFEWAKQSDAHYTPPSVVSFSYRHHPCWPSARNCMGCILCNNITQNITSPSPLAADQFSKIRIKVYKLWKEELGGNSFGCDGMKIPERIHIWSSFSPFPSHLWSRWDTSSAY